MTTYYTVTFTVATKRSLGPSGEAELEDIIVMESPIPNDRRTK